MWLLIDDTRSFNCDVIARTAEAARVLLGGVGYAFEGVYLDHDLGTDETGYDVLKWALADRSPDSPLGTLPKQVQLVTMNPVGRERMAQLLVDAGYKLYANGLYVHA